jgi:thiamine-phosphate pyrophosphorylase
MSHTQTNCQLYVVVEAGPTAHDRLAAALRAAPIASILIAPPAASTLTVTMGKPLVKQAQKGGAAALVGSAGPLAGTLCADGVHLGPRGDLFGAYQAVRGALGHDAIVGVDPGTSRHDAMVLAENGADYIAFGAPCHGQARAHDRDRARQRRNDLIIWWAELFLTPCVAFDVETAQEAHDLARRGADFIAVALPAARPPAAAGELVAEIAAAICSEVMRC